MSAKSQPVVSSGSSLPDGLFSSEIKKKIKRSFFKEDVAVKSYKCDVLGHDLDTSAKLYISNRAFYVVHRPKRKKLTTMPFTEISNIKARSDKQGVDVYCPGDGVYTFTGFQRPESAIAFILNFWNMIRKEKIVLRHCQINPRTELSGNTTGSTPQQCLDGTSSTTPESLRLPQIPTTISLNSSASISETDSMDSRRCSQDITSLSSEHLPLSSLEPTKSRRSTTNGSIKSSIISALDTTQAIKSNASHVARTSRTVAPDSRTTSNNLMPDNRSRNPSDQSDLADVSSTSARQRGTGSAGLQHSISAPTTTTTHHLQGLSRPLKPRHNHPCLSETPGWNLWPLSFLPYPFSSPPQRLTMIIAYAILGFLLFSTMHLYHRLAVFDLQGNPFVRTPTTNTRSIPVVPPAGSSTFRSSLQSLDRQLAELIELTGQLAQSLMHLTGEMRNMQFGAESSVGASPATPASPPSPPAQSAPPV